MDTLAVQFTKIKAAELQKKLGITNLMATPRLMKLVVNMGVKNAVADKKNVDRAVQVMMQITGQKPKITHAKKSIATFKLRQGDPIGVVVTLRGKRMYAFFEKLTNIVMPRLKDFRGVSRTSFDTKGNYTLGLSEYAVFPEVDIATVDRTQGMEIVIVTTAKTPEEGMSLLETLGMPFAKGESK